MSEARKLLIVDDSRVSRMLIKNLVSAMRPAWICEEAASGEEALHKALAEVFDYATVDINMPGMDGLELTEQFRVECPQLRVCLVSANIQEDSRRRGELLKAGFVRKPITQQSIIDVISCFEDA